MTTTKTLQRLFTAALILIAFVAVPGQLPADTVTFTGTVDVSEISKRLDDQQEIIERIASDIEQIKQALKDDDPGDDNGNSSGGSGGSGAGGDGETGGGDKIAAVGMGLADVSYYGRQWSFADLFLMSDAWRSNNKAYVFMSGRPAGGPYVLTWEGTGKVTTNLNAEVTARHDRRTELTIDPSGFGIELTKSGVVSDVHLRPAGWEEGDSPFNAVFLDRLRPFKVIRFMDWQRTNHSRQTRWSDRTLPGDLQSTRSGVALEYMIALANELRADPWFCMPHQADDDYIRRFAEMVHDRLDPGLTVYVEYSNEVWNGQFNQHRYIRQVSGGSSLSGPFFDLWAKRTRNTFSIWSEVFAGDADHRLVRVAAVHLANPNTAEQLLARLDGRFDAVAPSAYFGITDKQAKNLNAATTADDILNLCDASIRRDNRAWYKAHADLAGQWSQKLGHPIRLISYEAGQHLTAHGNDKLPYYDALIQAQTHPQMFDLYRLNMQLFKEAGGDLYLAFNDVTRPGKFGSWGHLEYQDQPAADAPKYRALIQQ